MNDIEIVVKVLEKTAGIILEERAILRRTIKALLLESEEMKRDELKAVDELLEDQKVRYIHQFKKSIKLQEDIENFVEELR